MKNLISTLSKYGVYDVIKLLNISELLDNNFKCSHIEFDISNDDFVSVEIIFKGNYSYKYIEELDDLHYTNLYAYKNFTLIDQKEEYSQIYNISDKDVLTTTYTYKSNDIITDNLVPSSVVISNQIEGLNCIYDYTNIVNNNNSTSKIIKDDSITYIFRYKTVNYSITRKFVIELNKK